MVSKSDRYGNKSLPRRLPRTHAAHAVVVANQSDSFFANGAAGMVGLGRSAGSASFIDTVFRTHGAWQNLTLALALNGAGTPQPGVMDVRATDPSLYSGDIQYYPVVAAAPDVPVSYPADWSLHLDSWTIDAGDIKTEHTTGGVAIVEPYFPEIRFPQDQAYLFCKHADGRRRRTSWLTFPQTETYRMLY